MQRVQGEGSRERGPQVCLRIGRKASGWNGEIKDVGRQQVTKAFRAKAGSSGSTLNLVQIPSALLGREQKD